ASPKKTKHLPRRPTRLPGRTTSSHMDKTENIHKIIYSQTLYELKMDTKSQNDIVESAEIYTAYEWTRVLRVLIRNEEVPRFYIVMRLGMDLRVKKPTRTTDISTLTVQLYLLTSPSPFGKVPRIRQSFEKMMEEPCSPLEYI
ncbi:hypothetical protein L9F63_025513, partial [Diploptera punctata]